MPAKRPIKITIGECGAAIEIWMQENWGRESGNVDVRVIENQIWIEFHNLKCIRESFGEPVIPWVRALLGPIRSKDPDVLPSGVYVVRLYQADPMPRVRHLGTQVVTDHPVLPTQLALVALPDKVEARDCFIAEERWGSHIIWPFPPNQ